MNRLTIIIIVALLPNMAVATWYNIPSNTDIGTWDGSTYTLTENVTDTIYIEVDNLTLDGAGHTVTGPGTHTVDDYGVYLNGRTGVTIKNINVQGFYNGIFLLDSDDNTVIDNTTDLNPSSGIRIQGSNNSITDNNVSNSAFGIALIGSLETISYNTLTGNTASNNTYGIYFQSYANNNTIYNNNFIDNGTQAYVDNTSSGNVFNQDLPIGGNYWSDWTTPDTDGDGIVDAPYIFTGGQDDYPWTSPNSWPVALEVDIDIKPGSTPNTINLGSNGVVPVAILSSDTFDATQVDPESVTLAGSGVAIRGKGSKYLASQEDVNGDGYLDLVCKVETENLDPDQFQDGSAILNGSTYGGLAITGSDEITIVPPE